MGETGAGQALVGYRDRVTELMEAGEPFGAVEDAIDESVDRTEEKQPQHARAHPAALA
jgi:hypothetical protein